MVNKELFTPKKIVASILITILYLFLFWGIGFLPNVNTWLYIGLIHLVTGLSMGLGILLAWLTE